MTALHLLLMEILVVFHVIGAAVLFRRLFPRESPWLAFFLPGLGLITLCNCIEYIVPLPNLILLLPITMGGLFWCMLNSRAAWESLRFPAILFTIAFTYCFIIRGRFPIIPEWGEGLADFARVLDFCHGDRLPPTDTWLPPATHGGYYAFQFYGASILIRLLMLDPGTGVNLSLVMLNAWICLAGAAVGHALTGKKWIATVSLLLVAGAFTGGAVIMSMFGPYGLDSFLAVDLHHGWADKHHNPLWKLMDADPYQTRTRLFPPGLGIYSQQYHPDWGGHFFILLMLLAVAELARETRTNAPWILLPVLPAMAAITSVWYMPVVALIGAGAGMVAWWKGRRPENLRVAIIVAGATLVLLLPSVWTLIADSAPQGVRLTTTEEHTWRWGFAEQWWPVYLPWLLLIFVWKKMGPEEKWMHAAVPLLLLIFEFVTIGWREPTLEKIWSGTYSAGLVFYWPLILRQRAWPFRIVTILFVAVIALSLGEWWRENARMFPNRTLFDRFQGDGDFQGSATGQRMLEVANRFKGATIMCGKMSWAYNLSPALAEFSGNRCLIGWSYPETLAGHQKEADARIKFTDDFYSGNVKDPLPYLAAHDVAAVLIWPEDEISDDLLARLQASLAHDYIYVDCKEDAPKNAGLFLRK